MPRLSNEDTTALAELFRSTEVQLEAERQSPEAQRRFPEGYTYHESVVVEGTAPEGYSFEVKDGIAVFPWEQVTFIRCK